MFHNIFKNLKKKKKEDALKIIIDVHEKNSFVPSFLSEAGMKIEFKTFEVGDYIVGNVIIERKTFSDFVNSMLSKRLKEQLKNLQQCKSKMLILEGREEAKGSINPNSVRGQILSILVNYEIPIIFTKNEKETAEYLVLLAKQSAKPMQETSMHTRIPKTLKEQKLYILEAFPGIGPKKARLLIKKFGTLHKIFLADENKLSEILKSKAGDFKKIIES